MVVWYREDLIRNFFLKKTFYLDTARKDLVEMILHVLFLL